MRQGDHKNGKDAMVGKLHLLLLVCMVIMEGMNKAIDEILLHDEKSRRTSGRVCLVCDKLMKRKEARTMSLKVFTKHSVYLKGDNLTVPAGLRDSYKFLDEREPEAMEALKECMLSPRSKLVYKSSDKLRRSPMVQMCAECKGGCTPKSLKEGKLPRFSLAGGMAVGEAPLCLRRLNEIELALVSQARFRGHLFTYWGGCHRSIKGWHTFYEVDPGHTAAVMGSVGKLTELNNIAVVLCGPFTARQKERVMKKIQVNVEWIKEAFEWLRAHNIHYRDMPMPTVGKPKVVDTSEEVESGNSDIEVKEEISVIFPDGTARTGGCNSGEEFDKSIAELRAAAPNTTPIVASRPSKRMLRDYEDHNLMKAFPLQFPYGHGSHEDFDYKSSENGYLKHLLDLSIPAFHHADFVLTIHNMFERSRALTGSIWQVMGGKEKCDVTEEELNQAISRKLKGLPDKHGKGSNFLKSVRSVKRNMAHSNEAASAAQAKFFTLSHHYGCPKVLLTVSFDDSLDIRIKALSGEEKVMDWMEHLEGLEANDLADEMDELNLLRYKYPGLCSYNFEELLDVVLEKVVGDNELNEGVFGKLDAYGLAVEEQGRKTLHAHILIYIRGWNDELRALQSGIPRVRKEAAQKLQAEVDTVMSTQLVPEEAASIDMCPACKEGILEFANDQQLRNLRHKHGLEHEQCVLCVCQSCNETYTGDGLAMRRVMDEKYWDLTDEEIKALVSVEILKSSSPEAPRILTDATVAKINHRFNNHLSHHTRTCFKKGDECRANLPDLEEPMTRVDWSEKKYTQYDWKGKEFEQHNITVRPKRHKQDAYTNTYCKAVSWSKGAANSNVSITTGCRSCIYCSCYAAKKTQKEDSAELKKLGMYVASRFAEERKESRLFEGLSRLMGAVIVGTSEHVVSAPMASYLVRNQSRFQFSEEFAYIPIREVVELLESNGRDLKLSVQGHTKGCFYSSQALHYLHRPKNIAEHMSMMDFFQEYYPARTFGESKPGEDDLEIDDTNHPGYEKQVFKRRATPALGQFSHWNIPDSSTLGGDIMDIGLHQGNSTIEQYCRSILVLFHPFRKVEDLTIQGSYFRKFRQLYHTGVPPRIREILGNVQMAYNTLQMPPSCDPIKEKTQQYKSPLSAKEDEDDDDDDFFDGLLTMLSQQGASAKPKVEGIDCLSLKSLRKEGARGCGFFDLPRVEECTPPMPNDSGSFVQIAATSAASTASATTNNDIAARRDRASMGQLMRLTYSNSRRRTENSTVGNTRPPEVIADGTAYSIIKWSRREDLNMDKEQQLAFQIATAAFVLTYYEEAEIDDQRDNGSSRHDFLLEKMKLRRLARLKRKEALCMFLDGAGGAGKSHVVNQLLLYGEQYTRNLNLTWDMRTVIVTAMSGVAATSIGGETTHSAVAFNRNIAKDDTSWANARLLIVDEVSFMNSNDVDILDEKLRTLMRRGNALFGGINVLFCGDFRQLEPIQGKPLYSPQPQHKKWVTAINCYVELKGLHRFSEDPEWGRILGRIRNDTYTSQDIDKINERVISQQGRPDKDIPGDISYCVYQNADRSAINTGVFGNVLKAHARKSKEIPANVLVVKASDMVRKTSGGKAISMQKEDTNYLLENCGDSRLRVQAKGNKGHFVDPLLKLYYQAPLMLVSNDDVPNGHANGTRVHLEKVELKAGASIETINIDGVKCWSVEAKDIEHLLCTHVDTATKTFKLVPKSLTCKAKVPVPKNLGGNQKSSVAFTLVLKQIPCLVNVATTGHKLQGQSKKNLCISVWSKRRNWNYVALSRVKTRDGLFLVSPLPYDTDFSMSNDLRAMMDNLRNKSPEEIEWDLQEEEEMLERRRRGCAYYPHLRA